METPTFHMMMMMWYCVVQCIISIVVDAARVCTSVLSLLFVYCRLLYQQHLLKKLRGQITNNRTQLQTIRTKSEQQIKKVNIHVHVQCI